MSAGEPSDRKLLSLKLSDSPLQQAGGATMTFRAGDGKTFKLKTFSTLVTMLQNTPNLLQKPVTQLFGKYPPKSNTKCFKNTEREIDIYIIYYIVTL